MKKWFIVPMALTATMFLFSCGGDFNGTGVRSGSGADITPPTILGTLPANGATNVDATAIIYAQFSEAINPFTVTAGSTFTLTDGVTSVLGFAAMYNDTWGHFNPSTQLAYSTTYTATITTGVTDRAGNAIAANYTWTFTTSAAPDTTPPTVIAETPANSATNVSVNTAVTAAFSEAMLSGSITTSTFLLSAGTTSVVSTVSYAGGIATLAPASALSSNTTYTATLTTGITDLAGNALAAPYVWSFTTAPTPSITTTTLPDATETGSYSQTLAATGGITPYTWSTTSTLPTGLTLSAAGVLSGTPAAGTAAGSPYTINVTLTDNDGLTATQTLTLTVITGPVITTTTLPDGTETGVYSQTLAATGGTTPYSWSTGSALPSGLTLSAAGVLSGTIAAATAGSYPITVTVMDAGGGTANQGLTLIVNAVPAVTTATLFDSTETGTYSQTIVSTGGTGTLTWNQNGLPAGMTFDTATGTIGGAPNAGTSGASPYLVGFTVTDSNLVSSATVTLSLTVNAVPAITTASPLPDATTGAAYSATLTATGGTTPYGSWSATALPAGLTFDAATGAISGTPTGPAGASTIDFTVTDANAVTSPIVTLSLTVL